MTPIANSMRLAFEEATADIPIPHRTRVYAMVRSALNRRLGLKRPKTGWTVKRARKRK